VWRVQGMNFQESRYHRIRDIAEEAHPNSSKMPLTFELWQQNLECL
jgi:hypothetical protein